MAKKGILDLPPEILAKINEKLLLQDEKQFREVCLGCPVLRQAYRDEIQESGVMVVDLFKIPRSQSCQEFVNDFSIFMNSTLKLSLTLPRENEYFVVQNLRSKLIELIDVCHGRISQIDICDGYQNVPIDLLKIVLTRLTQLKKIKIETLENRDSEIFQHLINNNAVGLENLYLRYITFTNVCFDKMANLSEIRLYECRGKIGIQSLLSSAHNLKKLKLIGIEIDTAIATTAGDNKNLEELELRSCRGEISDLLTQAANNISTLGLSYIDLNTKIDKPFTKLKNLKLERCRGEMSSLLTQAATYIDSLDLCNMHMDTIIEKPLINLKSVMIHNKDIDISGSKLLVRAGILGELTN